MKIDDFYLRISSECGVSPHCARKLVFVVVKHTPEQDMSEVQVDDAIFDKIKLMKQHNIPEEVMFIAVQNSVDWMGYLDVIKFWHELGAWSKKIGLTKEEIKQDIEKYKKNLKRTPTQMPLFIAVKQLIDLGFRQDFVFNQLLPFIIDEDTINKVPKDICADRNIVNILMHMYEDGWAETDIVRELKKQVNGEPGLDVRKLAGQLPKQLAPNERRISKRDGSIKISSRIDFLKYINPVLDFFTKNSNKIAELSGQYQKDNVGFARAFYDFYIAKRGWTGFAPELIIGSSENAVRTAGFSPMGFIVLNDFSSQEIIINSIVHELTHFEQYLMMINTPDVGIMPMAKEHVMQVFMQLCGGYKKDREERSVFVGDEFKEFEKGYPEMPLLLATSKKRFENDFYHNALKLPHKKITPESGEYATVKKFAEAHMITYDHKNHGNARFVYPMLFTEQMAFSVGNAAAVMFRNLVVHEKNRSNKELETVLLNGFYRA